MLLLGMVGFAEGVISAALGLMFIGVYLVTLCAYFGLFWRSRVAGIVGLFLVAVTAYLFQPWTAFALEPSEDWDAQSLQATYRWLAQGWVLASVAALGGFVRSFWCRQVATLALQDLTNEDLERCPIWRYEDRSDDMASISPAVAIQQPDRAIYIARTRFVLADNSVWWGYCSPAGDSGVASLRPVLLTPDGPIRFWCADPSKSDSARMCRLLGRELERVFPLRFECVVPVTGRNVSGVLTRIETSAEESVATVGPPSSLL